MIAAATARLGEALTPADLRSLKARSITPELAELAQLRRVSDEVGREVVGHRSGSMSGIAIPYFAPWISSGAREYRIRRDKPDIEYKDGKQRERAKYIAPPGRGNLAYFPPGVTEVMLQDAALPMIVTEGEFKALAGWGLSNHKHSGPRFLPVGLSGVWNWRSVIGKTTGPDGERRDVRGVIADFDRITWSGRRVVIAFDADAGENQQVQIARDQLKRELQSRGAEVGFLEWDKALGKGIDDLLAKVGPEAVLSMIDAVSFNVRRGSGGGEDLPRVREWPTPLEPEAFHGLAGEIVHILEPHSEADPVGLLIHLLVAFGNLIGRGAYFVVGGTRHFANLFAVLVGATACRKGTAKDDTSFVIRTVDPVWFDTKIQSGLSSGEGLVWAVRDPIEEQQAIKEKGRIVDYQTATTDPGVTDKRLMVIESEFGSTLRVLEREGNTLSAQVRQAWDSGDLRVLTKNKAARATGAHISIVGHITREELGKYLGETEQANGFANRYLWPCVRRSKLLPDGGDLAALELGAIRRRLDASAQFARNCGEVRRTEAAREIWRAVYPRLAGDRLGLFGAVTSRAEAQVMRLALVYALLDGSAVIEPVHLNAALAVWGYCEDSARFIFGDAIGDAVADDLLAALRAAPGGLTRTEISGHFGRNRSAAQVGRALSVLSQHGLIRQAEPEPGAGRPTERWLAASLGTKETNLTKEGVTDEQ